MFVTIEVFNVHYICRSGLPPATSSKFWNNFFPYCEKMCAKNFLKIWLIFVGPLRRYRAFAVQKFVGYTKKKKTRCVDRHGAVQKGLRTRRVPERVDTKSCWILSYGHPVSFVLLNWSVRKLLHIILHHFFGWKNVFI